MAKNREEIENPVIGIESHKRYKHPNPPTQVLCICDCGCEKEIYFDESYIIVDEKNFWDAEHVTDYFISQAGGRRVWGGFDDAS